MKTADLVARELALSMAYGILAVAAVSGYVPYIVGHWLSETESSTWRTAVARAAARSAETEKPPTGAMTGRQGHHASEWRGKKPWTCRSTGRLDRTRGR